jgi:lysozyme
MKNVIVSSTIILFVLLSNCASSSDREFPKSFGIDVSHHNGNINWGQVPDVEFVYIKATEGATYVDPMFQQNIKGAKAKKLRVGAYHYFRTTSSVQKQFENYKQHVKKSDIDLIPMVDVEECKKWPTTQFQDSLIRFIQLVKSHYGKAPMIYSVNTFYNRYCAPRINNYHLMIGRYGDEEPFIKGRGTYTIWQKSQTGRLAGIAKNVDINVFRKDKSINDISLGR